MCGRAESTAEYNWSLTVQNHWEECHALCRGLGVSLMTKGTTARQHQWVILVIIKVIDALSAATLTEGL
ncbi:hypothetical protein KQX54_006032 [Cotesia glomerata]|uniref:Uncharacterized protein n=1 Tax=Cotesia glomerata TaxID=32391 RepID=A0AAV7I5V8_COTGL|nr:hypothetical protein KQX54_006032 [Cotesia glomerata]